MPSHQSLHRHLPAQPSHPFDCWCSCWFGCVALLSLIFQWGHNVHWFDMDFNQFHSALFWCCFHTGIFTCFWGALASMVSFQNFGKSTALQFWNFIPLWLLWSCGDSLLLTAPSYSLLTTKLWWRWLINSRRGIITLCVCLDDLKFNVYFKAKHIPGKTNVIADRLSHFQEFAVCQAASLASRSNPTDLLPWLQWCCICSMQLWQRAHGMRISMLSLLLLPLARPIFLLPLFSPPP